MKIRIENFGPIHSFEMDLEKDMHILYGENSVGKSTAIAIVYLVVKRLQVIKAKEAVVLSLEEHFKSFAKSFNQLLPISFANKQQWKNLRLSSSQTSITLEFNSFQAEFILNPEFDLELSRIRTKQEFVGNESIGQFEEVSYLYFGNSKIAIPHEAFLDSISQQSLFFIPAIRSGLYTTLSKFGIILAKLSQQNRDLDQKFGIPTLSEPSSDFVLAMSEVREYPRMPSPVNTLGKKIESELLAGEIRIDPEKRELEYLDHRFNQRFPLNATSSMIGELAIIVAYFKFIGFEKREGEVNDPILFIEEPEAHLHPKVQVKLMEYFAELTKLGVKVIMTTHSNYIFNKASNMILKGELAEEKVANYHMIMTDKGSIVNPKDTLHDWGLEDENFVEVAEELLDERLEAIEKLNQ